MAEQYKKPYLESSVFIAWIKGESIPQMDAEGKEIGRENRADVARHILSLAEAGQFNVYTSSITIAEVHKRNLNKQTSESDTSAIDFFRSGFIKIIDVDRTVAESAHRCCRLHRLKPYDAVHLACAVRAGCDVLLTWDTDLLDLTHDGIAISKPQAIGQALLDLGAPEEAVPPIVTTVLDAQDGKSDESEAAVLPPSPPQPSDGRTLEESPTVEDRPASDDRREEDAMPLPDGEEQMKAAESAQSDADESAAAPSPNAESH